MSMDIQSILNPQASAGSNASIADTGSGCAGGKRKRGAAWEPWEDRPRVKRVCVDDRWRELSEHSKKAKADRSLVPCSDRINESTSWHRTQAVGEIGKHVRNMSETADFHLDSVSQNAHARQEAKDKLAARKIKGQKLREASMKGQVHLRDLLRAERDSANCASPPIPPRKTPKNQFAKEVESVIEGLNKEEEELRHEVAEKKKRDRERSEEQKVLINNMRLLIDSQRATNEMMQNWIDVSVKQATSYQA